MTYEDCANAGLTKTETAERMGVSMWSVMDYATRHGLRFVDGRRRDGARRDVRVKGEVEERVLSELRGNPCRTGRAIAEAADCADSYVTKVARQHGIRYGVPREKAPQFDLGVLSEENRAWLRAEAKRLGIAPKDAIDAIVTDARCEAAR